MKKIRHIIRVAQVESTNRSLILLSGQEMLPEGTVVVTGNQTRGRGQGSNSWESEPGKNLTFSMILYPTFVKGSEQFVISKVVSLAVRDFITQYTDNVSIKWPNDVYVAERKICGILIENFIEGAWITKTIAGIGVNINQEQFIGDARNPVSLYQITGKYIDIEDGLRTMLQCIADRYMQLHKEPEILHDEYIRNMYRFGEWKPYLSGGKLFEAKITGVNPYGMLEMLTRENEQKTFAFKEVVFMSG